MHEHRLARDLWPVMRQIAEEHHFSRVTHVAVDVGLFHGVTGDFLAHSFEHLFEGTIFQGAAVEVGIIEPGQPVTQEGHEPTIATGREIIIRKLTGE